MSKTANWSYTNIAEVRAVIGRDQWGAQQYGPVYEIACTWAAEGKQERDRGGMSGSQGTEFIGNMTFWTEDPRPKYGDQIRQKGAELWEPIRARMDWDMSFFGEIPDYRLVT